MAGRPDARLTFDVLNGLRGVAAIAVVNSHMSAYFGVVHSANVAPAVDFFFVLSGFVIAHAYDAKLASGGFLGLVATGLVTGTLDEGTQRLQILGGLARVTFGFFAGVALHRRWAVRPTGIHLHPALLFVLLPLPLLLKPGPPFGWLYELAVLTLYMPAIVWLGSGSRSRGVWLPVAVTLGALSYPLYMVHAPIWMAIRTLEGWQPTSFLIGYAPWSGIAMTAGLCAVAWWLDKAVDYPLRKRLYKAVLHRSTHAADPNDGRPR